MCVGMGSVKSQFIDIIQQIYVFCAIYWFDALMELYICRENTHFTCATWLIVTDDYVTNVTVKLKTEVVKKDSGSIKYNLTY